MLSPVAVFVVALVVFLGGGGTGGTGGSGVAEPETAPGSTASPAQPSDAPTPPAAADPLEQLDALAAPSGQPGDYHRDAFGPGWLDPDRNGCDARNDTLARDLVDVTFRPGTNDCVVVSGTLHDPYTGTTIAFLKGQDTSELVQIDHVVPLALAWRSGAFGWDTVEREAFANDPLNLLAVDGEANQSKSDSGPALWMPPNSAFACEYSADFIAVLAKYRLSITAEDRSSLISTLGGC